MCRVVTLLFVHAKHLGTKLAVITLRRGGAALGVTKGLGITKSYLYLNGFPISFSYSLNILHAKADVIK